MEKKIYKFLKIIFTIWIVLVILDCIRLRYSEFNTKPLITLYDKDSYSENELVNQYYNKKCLGLGYTIDYTTYNFDLTVEKERNFKLLGAITIWSQHYNY